MTQHMYEEYWPMPGADVQLSNEAQMFWLRDRRRLGYAEYGVAEGPVVLYCHGWPSSRLEGALLAEAAAACGVRLISIDRPGIGLSDVACGYTLHAWADDVRQLADGLQLQRFSVLGFSSGAPFTFACAHALSERLIAIATVGGFGPPPTQRFIYGGERMLLRLAQRSPQMARVLIHQAMRPLANNSPRVWQQFGRTLAPEDLPVFNDPDVRTMFRLSIQESLRQGAQGLVADMLHYGQQWHFTLGTIKVPCLIFHGAQDTFCAPAAAHYLATRLRSAQLRVIPAEGHLSVLVRYAAEMLKALV